MVHCSHYSELARTIDIFVLVRYCITGYVDTERAHYFTSARLSRTRIKSRMLSTVCVHITHATRIDTGQPGCAKRAGPARFGNVQLTLDSVHTSGNARQPGLRRQV